MKFQNKLKIYIKKDIPTKMLKENVNQCIKNSDFPSDLKLVEATLSCNKKSRTVKDNYRPISILPNVSKI